MTMFDDPVIRHAINEAMQEPKEQPLPMWLNKVFQETEELLGKVAGPTYRFMSKEDVMEGLGISYDDVLLMAQIGTRLQLIAANIDSRQPPKLTVVSNRNG